MQVQQIKFLMTYYIEAKKYKRPSLKEYNIIGKLMKEKDKNT